PICVYPELDCMPFNLDVFLPVRNGFTSGDFDLHLHKVNAGDHFCHRVFHLDPCIHFHEVESAVVQIIDEFDGARTDVVDTFCSTYCGLSHFCAFLFRKYRAWCFFDEFLHTALHCTVTLAEMDDI